MQIDVLLVQIAAGSLSLLFALSVLHKLSDWHRFKDALAGYQVLPTLLTDFVAPIVILAEAAVIPLLWVSGTRRLGALLAAILLVVYALAIGVNLLRGRTRIDCGCLGPSHRQRISSALLLRNGLLAAVAISAALPSNERGFATIDWLTMVGGIAMLALLYAIAEQLFANATSQVRPEHGAHA